MPDGSRPSIKTVAENLGISTRTVKRSIHELEGAGVLGVERRYRDGAHTSPLPNRYTFPALPKSLPGDGDMNDLGHQCHHTSDTSVTTLVTPVAPEVDIRQLDKIEKDSWLVRTAQNQLNGVSQQEPGSERDVDNVDNSEDVVDNGDLNLLASSVINPAQADNGKDSRPASVSQANESDAVAVVELLDGLRVKAHKKPMGKSRAAWLRSAHWLLDTDKDNYPVDEVCRLIEWACADHHWSSKITTVYDLRENYDELLAESAEREPRRQTVTASDGPVHRAATPPPRDSTKDVWDGARLEDL